MIQVSLHANSELDTLQGDVNMTLSKIQRHSKIIDVKLSESMIDGLDNTSAMIVYDDRRKHNDTD